MKTAVDYEDPADCKLAGSIFANIVASEAWPLLRDLAVHIREMDLRKQPSDLAALAALNGRQSGMKALLDTVETLASKASADTTEVSRSVAAQIIASVGAAPVSS